MRRSLIYRAHEGVLNLIHLRIVCFLLYLRIPFSYYLFRLDDTSSLFFFFFGYSFPLRPVACVFTPLSRTHSFAYYCYTVSHSGREKKRRVLKKEGVESCLDYKRLNCFLLYSALLFFLKKRRRRRKEETLSTREKYHFSQDRSLSRSRAHFFVGRFVQCSAVRKATRVTAS